MTQKPSAPTLQDVADAAGVSTATVSRCLNAPEKVVQSTRDRVMAAVSALGYAPNFGARAMAARRTQTVGAVVPTLENAIFARGLQAVQEELSGLGYHLLVASSSYRFEEEAAQVQALVARGADGVLLIGQDRAEETVTFLQQRGLPAVVAWTHVSDGPFPSVGFDNKQAMVKLVREVLALGHKELAVITAYTAQNDRARARLEGVREAVRDAGLDPEAVPIVETVYTIEAGAEAFEGLMAAKTRPTAVLCGNDVLAVGAIKRARQMGISVPEQVSITGFDDIEIAEVVDPELTTVRVPHNVMGRLAAKALVSLIENESPPVESQELRTFLQMRGSLAAPPDPSVSS